MPASRIALRINMLVRWLSVLIVLSTWTWLPTQAQAMAFNAPPARSNELQSNTPAGQQAMAAAAQPSSTANLHSTALFTATLTVNTQAAMVGSTLVYTLTLLNNSNTPETLRVSGGLCKGVGP